MASLAWLRRKALLSQRDLASRAGVGASSVYLIERGRVTPRPAMMRKLAAALEVRDPMEIDEFRKVIEQGGTTRLRRTRSVAPARRPRPANDGAPERKRSEPVAKADASRPTREEMLNCLAPLLDRDPGSFLNYLRHRHGKPKLSLEVLQRVLAAEVPDGASAEALRWARGKY